MLAVTTPLGQTTYSYDKNGNLVSKTDAAGTVNYVNNRANQLISMSDPAGKVTTFSYDRNGNLVTKTEGTNNTIYQYNFDGKLIKVTNADGSTTSCTYDGNGRRTSKSSQGETIKYYYDGLLVVKETDTNGAALAEYLYGINGSPVTVSITTGGKTYNYIYNSRGDTIALTNTAGAIAATYSYNPWGVVSGTSSIPNPFQYVGRYGVIHDQETGLDLMGLRYYDGNISRFIAADQFPGLVTEPITHNLYIYCNADPINNIDPTGQLAIGSIIKKAGTAIKKAVKTVKQVVKKAVTTVKKVVKQTAKKVATTVKKAVATVKKTVTQVKKTVATTVKTAVKTVSKAAAKVTQQVKTAVTDKGTASSPRASPTKILDAVQTGLDIAGFVPGFGEPADGTNALIYGLRGDKTNAALSAAACIPFAGWGAAGIKAVNKGVKALDKAGDVYDVGRGASGGTALMKHPFSDGATHLTTTSRLSRFPDSPTYGGPQGLYVSPRTQINELLSKGATRSKIEVMLGLEKGALSEGDLVRIDIANPFERNLRLPDPTTGNIYHRPGTGLTWGGLNESVLDSPLKGSSGVTSQIIGR